MQQSLRLAMAVLAAATLTAACSEGVVDSRSAENTTISRQIPIDDEGGGGWGGGGGTTIPPFNPPAPPYIFAGNLTAPGPLVGYYQCGQVTHAFWGFSNDVTAGTIIYLTGVVAPNTPMHWGIYNQYGQLVRDHWTQNSRDNCVVHHEPEGVSTAGLAPGYYFLYASYVQITNSVGIESSYGWTQSTLGKYVGPLRVR